MSIHVRVLGSGGDEGGALASSSLSREDIQGNGYGSHLTSCSVFAFEIFQCETKRVASRLSFERNEQQNSPKCAALTGVRLAHHPDEARAYRERAGTFYQLCGRSEARADAERAGVLGSSLGCALVSRL